jgi:hypothetical protein
MESSEFGPIAIRKFHFEEGKMIRAIVLLYGLLATTIFGILGVVMLVSSM